VNRFFWDVPKMVRIGDESGAHPEQPKARTERQASSSKVDERSGASEESERDGRVEKQLQTYSFVDGVSDGAREWDGAEDDDRPQRYVKPRARF
jgi:hypothetical protein